MRRISGTLVRGRFALSELRREAESFQVAREYIRAMARLSNQTLAQRGSLGLALFFLVTGTIGLIVNPDFGTGSELTSKLFLIDWNGWHAVGTLVLGATAFVAAARPLWAVAFLAGNVIANATTAVWALIDSTPLGIIDLPHVGTDVAVHLAVTAVSLALFVAQVTRGRRTSTAH
jgi:hypothetical protein